MSEGPEWKLQPRNAAAVRAAGPLPPATGNPASVLLESGVGNCFPGLECDLRNLERRFFPFLEVDANVVGGAAALVVELNIVGVDAAGAAAAGLPAAQAAVYAQLAADLGQGRDWKITGLKGDFGPLGQLDFALSALGAPSTGPGRRPADAWTAVRLLKEDSVVQLTLRRTAPAQQAVLSGRRTRYLDPNGALARIFEPGELSQSLCSPWTHDFRDCACFYWASNHPDIALPPVPAGVSAADDPRWSLVTDWLREDRNLADPPASRIDRAAPRGGSNPEPEIPHHRINRDWQKLAFVLERREVLGPYVEQPFVAAPLANRPQLLAHLKYAAGVELAIMQEYLAAAWSLRNPVGAPNPLRDDLKAAFAEILRVAIGEMRHLRAVNSVARGLNPTAPFTPLLGVATKIPSGGPAPRPVAFRAATPAVLDEFVEIEAPSQSVDGLYGRILATLEEDPDLDPQAQRIRTVMAEGEEHWQTFRFVREWLGRHTPAEYLRSAALAPAPAGAPAQQTLQTRYEALLDRLFLGYQRGGTTGALDINTARTSMLGPGGMEGALNGVAAANFLVTFAVPADPRFAAVDPPP
ncbi:MAG: ferritin-like domain-containing protein [Phenylobacterium sp.]